MEKKLFRQLVESIKEMGEVRKGTREPGRIFEIDPVSKKRTRKK